MKKVNPELEKYRVTNGDFKSDSSYGSMGAFVVPSSIDNAPMFVISDDGTDSKWEHVSISRKTRCPNWIEMCFIKDLFWSEEETVIQYHPPKSQYINEHSFVLHLWKPKKIKIPLPPSILVGLKKKI